MSFYCISIIHRKLLNDSNKNKYFNLNSGCNQNNGFNLDNYNSKLYKYLAKFSCALWIPNHYIIVRQIIYSFVMFRHKFDSYKFPEYFFTQEKILTVVSFQEFLSNFSFKANRNGREWNKLPTLSGCRIAGPEKSLLVVYCVHCWKNQIFWISLFAFRRSEKEIIIK